MIRRSLLSRLTLALAVVLVSAQVLGLHYHRHVSGAHHGAAAGVETALATSWDPGAHFHIHETGSGAHADSFLAPDHDVDVEVASDAAKGKKAATVFAGLPPGSLEMAALSDRFACAFRDAPARPPDPFQLRPPSQAPPVLPS